MSQFLDKVSEQLETALTDLFQTIKLNSKKILVVGVSTSEVIGQKIGTAGSDEVAEKIFSVLSKYQAEVGFHLAFQCCEHLNRALVVRESTLETFRLNEVTVIPVPKAGGAMASFAYRAWKDAYLVEEIEADAGIDIGQTLIGMHLKRVAVPVRSSVRTIGEAVLTMAITRPKLIGGARAVYHSGR